MIFNEDQSDAAYQIKSYDSHKIKINDQIYQNSIIITPNTLIPNWRPRSLAELGAQDLQAIIDLQPEIVLLGTGNKFKMPPAKLLQPLYEAGLGVECMDTGAACRTYTALMAEGRNVVAAILIS
jgi:uncharacterized protein